MNRRRFYFEAAPSPAPLERPAHLIPLSLIELPYLDVGRATYVITDENAWLIGRGMALGGAEEARLRDRLQRQLNEYEHRDRPRLVIG